MYFVFSGFGACWGLKMVKAWGPLWTSMVAALTILKETDCVRTSTALTASRLSRVVRVAFNAFHPWNKTRLTAWEKSCAPGLKRTSLIRSN